MFKEVERAFPDEMRPAIEKVKDAAYTHVGDPYFVKMNANGQRYIVHVVHSVQESDEFEGIEYDSHDGLIKYQRRVAKSDEEPYYDQAVIEEEQILRHTDPTGQ